MNTLKDCTWSQSMMPPKTTGGMMNDMSVLTMPIKFLKCFSKKKLMCCMKKDLKDKMPNMDASNFMSLMMTFDQVVLNDVDPEDMIHTWAHMMVPPMENLF